MRFSTFYKNSQPLREILAQRPVVLVAADDPVAVVVDLIHFPRSTPMNCLSTEWNPMSNIPKLRNPAPVAGDRP